jgi:hypothetical protein
MGSVSGQATSGYPPLIYLYTSESMYFFLSILHTCISIILVYIYKIKSGEIA